MTSRVTPPDDEHPRNNSTLKNFGWERVFLFTALFLAWSILTMFLYRESPADPLHHTAGISLSVILGAYFLFIFLPGKWNFYRLHGPGGLKIKRDSLSPPVQNYIDLLGSLFLNGKLVDISAAIMTAIAIHFAKADGKVDDEELDVINTAVKNSLLSPAADELIHRSIKISREHLNELPRGKLAGSVVALINYYNTDIMKELGHEDSLRFILILCYETVYGDYVVHPGEEELFDRVCNFYNISFDVRERIKRTATFYRKTDEGEPEVFDIPGINHREKYITLFELPENYTGDELEMAWRKSVLLYHPDRFHNSPPEIYREANERFLKLREAYDVLRHTIGAGVSFKD